MKRYEFKTIHKGHGVFTVVKFYKSPTMGECHVGYMVIAAKNEEAALETARQAM